MIHLIEALLIVLLVALLTASAGVYRIRQGLKYPAVRKPPQRLYESKRLYVTLNGVGHGIRLSRNTWHFGRLQITHIFRENPKV